MRLISDDTLAAVTIMQEAEGEPYEGKVAVAEVIRNRTARKFFSDGTVAGTVLRPLQFSGMNSGSSNRVRTFKADDSSPIVQDCIKAWAAALAGSNTVQGAMHYVNLDIVRPSWVDQLRFVGKIGQHSFYT